MNRAVRAIFCGLAIGLALRPALAAPSTGRYTLSNGYISVSGAAGSFDSFKADPAGKSNYGPEIVKKIWPGADVTDPVNLSASWEQTGNTITIRNVRIYSNPQKLAGGGRAQAVRLEKGRKLGQSFVTSKVGLSEVAVLTPTWNSDRSGVTLTIRKEGPRGEVVASQQFKNIVDNSWVRLTFPAQPKGRYYIEISDPVGPVGWWTGLTDTYDGGEATADGNACPLGDRMFEAVVYDVFPADITYRLEESKLFGTALTDEPKRQITWSVKTPWERDRYSISDPAKTPFSRFFSDQGHYMPTAQLKRKSSIDWNLDAKNWVYATGTGNVDLRFATNQSMSWKMTEDSMTLGLGKTLEVAVLPHSTTVPEFYPAFYSSNAKFDRALNEFLYDRAFTWPTGGINPDWFEWMALVHFWTGRPGVIEYYRERLLTCKQNEEGYIYTWGENKGWPFPDNSKYDTRHFTTNANFILASYRFYAWTRDINFLKKNATRLRKAMDFQLEQLDGKSGIITLPAKDHGGTPQDLASNYWDDIPFGGKSAYENIYFYASLGAMAEIESALGNTERAKELKDLREKAYQAYNATFWNDKAGRYIGCIDENGVIRDYGFTFVNTEAMTYGLADKDKAQRIYRWMEHEKTSSGKTDTYSRFRFAPRANTLDCKDWWYLEGKGEIPSQPFDTHLENGGAILYTSYYDVCARAKLLDANNALKRLEQILERYQEPDRLCGGTPLMYGEINGWQVGTDIPFPESGLVPCSFLYAFLGIQATSEGLQIRPNLPDKLKFAGIKNLYYKGIPLDIKVTRSSVSIKCSKPGNEFQIEQPLKRGEGYLLKESQWVK